MIRELLEKELLSLVQATLPDILIDSWEQEHVFVSFPELKWTGPTMEAETSNWVSVKRFEGQAYLLLYSDKASPIDPTPLIAKLARPLSLVRLDESNNISNHLGCRLVWEFKKQREFLNEIVLTTQLEGNLTGTLMEKY
ncbi:MAG: hypothetical protein B6247_04005 [Candidatus Parabeggiatoa sp. nov. 2]|nr:MAG: hypothetical protein B6247_04005 [Beggiatoa sp. 4572_84]